MLDEQVKIYNEQQDNMWDTAAPQSNNSSGEQETITEIDVIVDAKTVAQVSGIAILLVLVSSLVGVAYITRYEPVKILTERG